MRYMEEGKVASLVTFENPHGEPVTVQTLKLFGGHAVLDFTNTINSRGARYGPDVLHSYGDLLDWAERRGILAAQESKRLRALPPRQGEAALRRAKRLREALYRIFAQRPAADAADLDLLEREVRSAQEVRRLIRSAEGYVWQWQPGDPDAVTHKIALSAAELLTSAALERVHVCPGENCAWLFLDTSRSGRRIWCSEETCGTRNRVRRWRDRRRAEA